MFFPKKSAPVFEQLCRGVVIPAHPLALDSDRRFDEARQRALTRYYVAAGAGGIAVGVHTTQFAIRDARHGLLEPVLRSAVQTARDAGAGEAFVLIAGVCGPTDQALGEARLASGLGYHAGLLSLSALAGLPESEMLAHAERVAREIPLVGFYLQPAVGGPRLSVDFWRAFARIENVVAIKIAPFNRYATLDVVRGVAESGRADSVALYTGNDDSIVADLVTELVFDVGGMPVRQHIVGGLLGQWAVGTRAAVALLERCRTARESGSIPGELLRLGARLTDMNAALFDVANNFAGCIAGINEVLRRQGLLGSALCLDEHETLSPGQAEEIDRVLAAYPELTDGEFISEHIEEWMRE